LAILDVAGEPRHLLDVIELHAVDQPPTRREGRGTSNCPSTKGTASLTPGTLPMRSVTAWKSLSGVWEGVTMMWPLKPRIFDCNSTRKPFITDITMIRIATPSRKHRKEMT